MVGILESAIIVMGATIFTCIAGLNKPEDEIWKKIQLKSASGKYPHLLDKYKSEGGKTFVFYIPDGISMDMIIDPKNPKHAMLRQGLANNRRMEITQIDGHKLSIKVIEKPLSNTYDFAYEPVDPKYPLSFYLGEGYNGKIILTIDNNAPHICIAGTTGSGKSICLRILICSMILCPIRVELHLIDMKGGSEFFIFQKCERVVSYAKNSDEGLGVLRKLQEMMDRRYELFTSVGARDIDAYNELMKDDKDKLLRQVLLVDEFAQFAAKKNRQAQDILCDLLQRARAAGIHVIVATQHPTKEVIDTQIKANMPAYICFKVANVSDSILVLGHGGAEQLKENGRGILRYPGKKNTEFQGYYLEKEQQWIDLISHTYIDKTNQQKDDTKGAFKT